MVRFQAGLLLLCGLLSAVVSGVGTATSALAADDEQVRFAVIGDFGAESDEAREVASLVISWDPDFIVTTGDNNYPRGEASTIDRNVGQYYHAFIHPYSGRYGAGATENRFFPSLGNHDWMTDSARPYLDYFTLPGNERYYDLVRGPVHLFALDSDPREPDGVERDSAQAQWLRRTLAASTSCWQLVYFHHAPYSSSEHGSNEWMQWPYKEWGADAVVSGHDHTYERIVVDGLPYFVNGLGGRSRYEFNAPIPGSEVRYNASEGAMRVVADRDRITYEFVATDGTVVDSYTQFGGCAAGGAATRSEAVTTVQSPSGPQETTLTDMLRFIARFTLPPVAIGVATVVLASLGLRQALRRRTR